jgi:hypothetical protein
MNMQRWLIGLCLALWAVLAPAQERVEVITLNYRTAAEVIPVIEPLVGAEGALTGMQNKLIIRTDAARLAQIKDIIASLDTRPRRLMITVRQNVTREALEQEASVYGTAGGEHGRITVPPTPGRADARIELGDEDDRVGAKVRSTQGAETSGETQQVQVLEGNAAFIQAGQSVPYRGRTVYRDAFGRTVVEDNTSYRDVTSGFYVLPRVQGDRVTLEINPQRNTLGQRGAVNVQQASTVLSGRLGEWIELGGIRQQAQYQGSGIGSFSRQGQSDERSIFVRVEEIR